MIDERENGKKYSKANGEIHPLFGCFSSYIHTNMKRAHRRCALLCFRNRLGSRCWRVGLDGALRHGLMVWIPAFAGMTAILTFLDIECGSILRTRVIWPACLLTNQKKNADKMSAFFYVIQKLCRNAP
jgi:hypothetical protein